jgi:hypothetical protein
MEIVFSTGEGGRKCGGCTLCCKLLPTREVDSKAGERCQHQRTGKGCAIYERRPFSCRMWACRWLAGDDTADLRRPDHSRYVIDIMPDYVTMQYEDQPAQHVEIVQIWCDPRHPDAHRDPALREFMFRRALEGKASMIRFNSEDAIVIFPPPLSSDGEWHERTSGLKDSRLVQHDARDIFETLAGLR